MHGSNQSSQIIDDIGEVKSLKILTIIDNDFIDSDLETAWGLSFHVEANGNPKDAILMDCSGSLHDFARNLTKLKVDLSKLKAVHISHWHYDHAGCLDYVLTLISKSTSIYVPTGQPSKVNSIKKNGFKIFQLGRPCKIFDGVISTGSISNGLSEQSLVFNLKNKGLVILLGCAHPGLIPIIERSKEITGITSIHALMGGFHVSDISKNKSLINYLKNLNLQLISPCHCTGDKTKAYLRDEYQEKYVKNGSGLKIII